MRLYAASMSVLVTRMGVSGWRLLMSLKPWRKRRKAWPNWQSGTSSFLTLRLQLRPEGPGKVQSWVVRLFRILSPTALMDHWTATPKGVTLAPGMRRMQEGVIGMAH